MAIKVARFSDGNIETKNLGESSSCYRVWGSVREVNGRWLIYYADGRLADTLGEETKDDAINRGMAMALGDK